MVKIYEKINREWLRQRGREVRRTEEEAIRRVWLGPMRWGRKEMERKIDPGEEKDFRERENG